MAGRPSVVLVTGAAPYLGGRTTWLPLRCAAPQIDFTEIDALDFAGTSGRSVSETAEAILAPAIRNANAVVAHAGAARPVIEVVARERPNMPVLLLSPLLATRANLALEVIRSLLGRAPGSWLLTAYARSKQRRLTRDRRYVAAQLKPFVGNETLSEALIEEAQMRLATRDRTGLWSGRRSSFVTPRRPSVFEVIAP